MGGGGAWRPGEQTVEFFKIGVQLQALLTHLNIPHTSLYALFNLLASKNSRGLTSLNSFLKTVALKKLNYSMFK